MRKLIIAFLTLSTLLICFGICGCSVKNSDELVMVTNANFPPYEYLDGNGNFAGIDIEIGQAIADKLGKKLVIKDIKFEDILDGVKNNTYDFGMAALTVDDERKEKVNFSNTYANGVQVVIVKNGSTVSSFNEFYGEFDKSGNPIKVKEGIKIGVQKDTTGDSYSSNTPQNWGFGEENVKRYDSGDEAIVALLNDEVAAVIIDNEPAKAFLNSHEGLKILDGAYADEDYAIIVSKENSELLGKINNAISELEKDGILTKIIGKYIK